ncbi:hypothetical protein [Mycobacterium sp. AT1]|uniref:hypothetical protein n=1 Tax=Mycobacterium sp. AT1 TaxID=1961706 RepID=UPI0009AE1402|nr:hypothetical protein [Mycobacterium sp. AT1]OPX06826.1 hypothetical protein B1790_25840 [Mycobacterium sp. AT1]
MTATRVVIGASGLGVGGYGALLLWDNPPTVLMQIALWAGVAVVAHDFVFAPVCTALGLGVRRVLPRRWWGTVGIAALCSVTLVLVAIPVFDRPGARPDNQTVLDRNYPMGLGVSLAVVWACAAIFLAAPHVVSRVRRPQTDSLPHPAQD